MEIAIMDNYLIHWQRVLINPFIKPQIGTVAPDAVTTPDILDIDGNLHLYIGSVDKEKERIIHMQVKRVNFLGSKPLIVLGSATVVVDAGPYDFDCKHVFDPATIVWNNQIYLYYSAIGRGEDSIGLAISKDGEKFIKIDKPIITGRSPEVVIKGDMIYMFFIREWADKGYSIYLAQSKDGYNYSILQDVPVLTFGSENEWDNSGVTTPRIIKINNTYYMLYAGLNRNDHKDVPRAFGISRSVDLVHWEKYSGNPVFKCGSDGSWDDGGIWFGTTFRLENKLFLMYEGGRLENILNRIPALTQIGLAEMSVELFKKSLINW